jgi:hypothetical protein
LPGVSWWWDHKTKIKIPFCIIKTKTSVIIIIIIIKTLLTCQKILVYSMW